MSQDRVEDRKKGRGEQVATETLQKLLKMSHGELVIRKHDHKIYTELTEKRQA